MNEPKSARYHRLKRRTGILAGCGTALLLVVLLWLRPSLHGAVYVVMLVALHELLTLPLTFYRSYTLERRYELSTQSISEWAKDHLKGVALTLAFTLVAAHVVYTLIAWSPGVLVARRRRRGVRRDDCPHQGGADPSAATVLQVQAARTS